jgi:hypothetical protein
MACDQGMTALPCDTRDNQRHELANFRTLRMNTIIRDCTRISDASIFW